VASTSVILTLNGKEYTVHRATLKLWLYLEEQKEQIKIAAENGQREKLESSFNAYISAVLDTEIEDLPWYEVVNAFSAISNLNKPSFDFPFLRSAIEETRIEWDYDGRTWYIWLHLLSSKGWSIEYISNLEIDDAIGLAQEIAIDKQLELEAKWAMSQNAYNADGKFQPLKRPAWMKKPLEIVKIPKKMMPVGLVINFAKDGTSIPQ
jgi:hypothetical protein